MSKILLCEKKQIFDSDSDGDLEYLKIKGYKKEFDTEFHGVKNTQSCSEFYFAKCEIVDHRLWIGKSSLKKNENTKFSIDRQDEQDTQEARL